MKIRKIIPALAVALGLSSSMAKADAPSGIEVMGGMETITETRPESESPIKLSGMNLSVGVVNYALDRLFLDAEVNYRNLSSSESVGSLETITASFKPMYTILTTPGTLDVKLSGGMSALYHRTAADAVALNPVIGLVYSYARVFVAPRVKLVTSMHGLFNEIGLEVGGTGDAEKLLPYMGMDARLGYAHDFNSNISVSAAFYEEGRALKGEMFGNFGAEIRLKLHKKAPALVVKGFLHKEKNDLFKGNGEGFSVGLDL